MRRTRRLAPDTDIVAFLLSLSPDNRRQAIELLGQEERDALDRAWPDWAHEGQRAPPGDWRTWVIMAGRGFGKTLAGANWITEAVAAHAAPLPSAGEGDSREARAGRGGPLRIALVGATLDEARRVMIEGRSGLLTVADAWIADWRPSRRLLTFRTGARATLFSGASPEALRGPEHHFAWCDELAKWEKPGECWDMLQLGLRLGAAPRALVTTTPRPGPVLKRIMAAPGCVVTGGPTRANPHLPDSFKRSVEQLYGGTRLGRQELDGVLLTDAPGALWTVEVLERCRIASPLPSREGQGVGERSDASMASRSFDAVSPESGGLHGNPPPAPPCPGGEVWKIAIGVDPPTGDGTCGIIACARDSRGTAHVLADHSVTALSPEGWARAVADAAAIHSVPLPSAGEGDSRALARERGEGAYEISPLIVAERNQGGKMVQSVLHAADSRLRIKLVTATHGKAVRAEPVAFLFEAGKVRLHGRFPELEAELLGMIAGGAYEGPGVSPDRADAMVWALTELLLGKEQTEPRVRSL